jgi:3-isopropylmalate/(R)-2-methylmalate dehydratase small subunit
MRRIIGGKAYTVGDDVGTEQIVPVRCLSLVPVISDDRRRLGRSAMSGLPRDRYPRPLVEPGRSSSDYRVIIAGRNFGCGAFREHAPIALRAAGIRVIVAESFAPDFHRYCIETGQMVPVESEYRINDAFETGDCVEIDLQRAGLRGADSSAVYPLRPLHLLGDLFTADETPVNARDLHIG